MGLLISKTDFTGKYAIAQNALTNNIDAYILKYEEKLLMELLGVSLFKLFKANVDGPTKKPANPIYLNLYDPIAEDDTECNKIRMSNGIKDMLLGFIYFEYVRDSKTVQTSLGPVKGTVENSKEADFSESIYGRYNEAVRSHKTIQWYIGENSEVYPEFNGISKKLAYWI